MGVQVSANLGKSSANLDKVNWSDLETKHYVVCPNFLTEHELNALRVGFSSALVKFSKRKNDWSNLAVVQKETYGVFFDKMLDVAARVKAVANCDVDIIGPYSLYFNNGKQTFPFHQDAENQYICDDMVNYLNFYIPVYKPERNKSGLTIIPFDALKKQDPEYYARTVRTGARLHFDIMGKTRMFSHDAQTSSAIMPFSANCKIGDLAVSPEIGPGDLLLMRGDLIHKTQDDSTRRLAASIRMVSSRSMVTRRNLVTGPPWKMLLESEWELRSFLLEILGLMDRTGRDEVPFGEVLGQFTFDGSSPLQPLNAFVSRVASSRKLLRGNGGAGR